MPKPSRGSRPVGPSGPGTEDRAVASLQVAGVCAGYRGGPDVIRDVSFDVRRGEVVAVLGRNGAGKTTLLRALSGLLSPRQGEITLNGTGLRSRAPHAITRAGLGHVPEGRRVFAGMTVLDNLRLGGYTAGSTQRAAARLGEVLDILPVLAGWGGRTAGTLSGGEQQLLSIGRALMADPSILMLDEPLTGLSPSMRRHVLQALSDIRASGRSLVIVEQNAAETLPYADRGLVLDTGRVVLEGTAAAMLDDPAVQNAFLGTSSQKHPVGTERK